MAEFDEIRTLTQLKDQLEMLPNKSDVVVFFDWDDTLVKSSTKDVLEPAVTKALFKYLDDNIEWYVLTGRGNYTDKILALDDCNKTPERVEQCNRYYFDMMERSTTGYMYPALADMGVEIPADLPAPVDPNTYQYIKLGDDIVGIVYMGILYSTDKGRAIEGFMQQNAIDKNFVFFVDDNPTFLKQVQQQNPLYIVLKRIP
jgi:hypothetical protein